MLAKAVSLGADELVIDFEDAVAPSLKDGARERLALFLAQGGGAEWLGKSKGVGVSVLVP
jgi:citrate lyase beta subunit